MKTNELAEKLKNGSLTVQDYEAVLKWCYANTEKIDLSNSDNKYLYEMATLYLTSMKIGKWNENDARFLINYLAKNFANDRGIEKVTIEILGDDYKEKTGSKGIATCDYSSKDGHIFVYYSQKIIEDLTSNNGNDIVRWIANYFS